MVISIHAVRKLLGFGRKLFGLQADSEQYLLSVGFVIVQFGTALIMTGCYATVLEGFARSEGLRVGG